MTRAYSVCLFTAWEDRPYADVWVKRVIADAAPDTDGEPLFGIRATSRDRHPLPEGSADACTGQRTVGPWHLRLPHFRPDRTPASGDELQTEYFVPWEHAPAAIATVTALGTDIRPVLPLLEEALAPYGARPHWGKLFTYPREYLERVYGASMQRFRDAAGALDPRGRFRNEFLDRWVFDG